LGGGTALACATTAPGSTRSSAIALASDDSALITVNRDTSSVTAMSVDYSGANPALNKLGEVAVGNEPWAVAIDGCNTTAYVVTRKDQKVVEITGVKTVPTMGRTVAVGSEPAGIAITPNNKKLYVSNWVDGTLSVIDTASMTVSSTVDLNTAIAATGLLGSVTARPALAHPRGIAITNNGDTNDDDETVYVTEWFALRTGPETAAGTGSDTNWKGLIYAVNVGSGMVRTLDLPPITDTGFNDAKGQATGCFPNQVGTITIDGAFAYVTSTCASPVGPTGVFQKGACALDSQCSGGLAGSCVNGACKGACTIDSDCGVGSAAGACNIANGGICSPLAANAKTTTHPGLSIVDLTSNTVTTVNLDKLFTSAASTQNGMVSTRMPLLPTDVGFRPGFAYVSAMGADAVFRLTVTNGAITKVGAAQNDFIDVHNPALGATQFSLPIGIAVGQTQGFAFVANDGTRDVTTLALNAQALVPTAILSSTALPAAGSQAEKVLIGKRLFTTGLGRWSLAGAAWGSCAACHIDGLTDNVTWYFARGPRQTISLDGTFNKNDSTDQRIMNWTGILDEVADFEGNVRGISGGVGALVSATSTPPVNADRINLFTSTPPQQGLIGSSTDIATPGGASSHTHSVIPDWLNITEYVKQIRSPRAPTNLVMSDVMTGQMLFTNTSQGNCIGCHSGGKWTISKLFYTPGDGPNDAFSATPTGASLSAKSWNANLNGFPSALFPSSVAGGKTTMRSGPPPTFEQLQCVLRPVGTISANGAVPGGVSPMAVGVLELRQDMVTGAQGAGGINANDFTTGFNPPSLLGLQVGAPYFHAGNARTLEELLSSTFIGHYQSPIASVFNPNATQVKQLVAFMLSIDGSTTPVTPPTLGNLGGDLCSYP
jgi:YVTN family beta-propeller protein